jgi:Yip1 domain
MATTVAPPPPASEPAPANSFSRIFGVLFSPTPTFASIAERPTWILPVLLSSLIFIGVVGVFSARGGWPSFFQKQDAKSSRFQQLSQEQQDQALERQVKFGPPFGYVEGVILPVLSVVIVAAVYLLLFRLAAGAEIPFGTAMGIVSYAWVPLMIHGLLSILILFLKDPATVDLQNLVASNPGALLGDDAAKWLVALLGSIDIFTIWSLVLMAMGFRATNPKKIAFGKALGIVLSAWVFLVILKVGAAAIF